MVISAHSVNRVHISGSRACFGSSASQLSEPLRSGSHVRDPIMWAVLMWGSPWWAARNQFSKQSVAHGPRTMRLDSTGVHWRDEGSIFTLFVAPRASISSRNAHSHSIKWPRSEILLRKISCLARRQLTTRKSVHGPGFAGNDNSGCAPRDG